MTGAEPLFDLLARCVVRIDRGGEFTGTGFFVASGEVLTCAHVVHGGQPITVTTADGDEFAASRPPSCSRPTTPKAGFYPQPDAALLRLVDPPAAHPCVRLEATDPAVGETLQLTRVHEGRAHLRRRRAQRRTGASVPSTHTLVTWWDRA